MEENNDKRYGELINELEIRKNAPQVSAVKELLPELFARDLSEWLIELKKKSIIFLDTYEILTGDETGIKRHERLVYSDHDVSVDWWIEKLLAYTDNVLWIIAGRSNITKIGDNRNISVQEHFILNVLNEDFADKFLSKAGIDDSEIRKKIFSLTGGYPNYLKMCVNTYRKICAKNMTPTVKDFGDDREAIVNRLIGYMDESAQNMVKRLCIMGKWTDDIAQRILGILHENNNATYNRVKKLSFIFTQSGGSKSTRIICFDRSIQKILFDHLKATDAFLIEQTRGAVNEFFRSKFYGKAGKKISEDDKVQLFKFWYEIILRTTDDANALMMQYAGNLSPLTNLFDDTFVEDAVKKFMDKVRSHQDKIPYAYFEHLLAKIKLNQGKDKAALKYAEFAYSIFAPEINISVEKISVINTLAEVYKNLKRTAKEIEFRKKALAESKKIFRGKSDKNIIAAQQNLAYALERGDKKNMALEIFHNIWCTLENFDDERMIQSALDYVRLLEKTNKYNKVISIREKIIDYYRRTNDSENLIGAITNLVWVLKNFSDKEHLEKKLSLQKELVEIYTETGGEYSKEVVAAHYDVFNTLENLNLNDEAILGREELYKKFETRLDETQNLEDKVTLMKNLADIAVEMNQFDVAAQWKAEVVKILSDIVETNTRNFTGDYEGTISLINTLMNELNWETDYSNVVNLQKEILRLTKENPVATDEEIITAMKYYAYILTLNVEGYDKALSLRQKIVERLQKKFSYDLTNSKILNAMNDVAIIYEKFTGDFHLALSERQAILNYLQKHKADERKILSAMKKIAELWAPALNNYVEALRWRKNILKYCREKFPTNSPEIIDAMENLASIHEDLQQFDDAEKLRTEIIKIKKEINGDESSLEVINAEKAIADQLHAVGNYDEELKIREEIVALHRKNYADNSGSRYEIVNALNDVAELLSYLGRDEDAYKGRTQIVNELKREYAEIVAEFGEKAERAVRKAEEIADALREIRSYEEELTYRRKILKWQKTLDENFDETFNALSKLIEVFVAMGNEVEEFKMRCQVRDILQNRVNESVDKTAKINSMYLLTAVEKDLGHDEEVTELEEEILNIRRCIVEERRKNLGENHRQTIKALKDLAEDLRKYNRRIEELSVRRDIESYVQTFEEKFSVMKDIAENLNCLGDIEGALNEWLKILRLCYEHSGNVADKVLYVLNQIALVYEKLGHGRAVLKMRCSILNNCLHRYAEDNYNSQVMKAIHDKAVALKNLDRYDDALNILREIVDNPITKLEDIAQLLEDKGDYDGAISERENIVEMLSEQYPVSDKKVYVAMKKVADLLEDKGDYKQALQWRQKICDVSNDFVESGYSLADTLDTLERHKDAQKIRENILINLETRLDKYIGIYGKNSDKVIETLQDIIIASKKIFSHGTELAYEEMLVNILTNSAGVSSEKTLAAIDKLAETFEYDSE